MPRQEIPPGLCQCGCGKPTRIAERTRASRGWVKGEPLRFVPGHADRKVYYAEDNPDWYLPNTLNGLCHCGCGLPTKPARTTSQDAGTIKGELRRYVADHHIVNDERALTVSKVCSHCKVEKLLRCYYKNKSNPDGYSDWCMSCQVSATPYDKKVQSVNKLRYRNRKYVWEYQKAHPCVDCGESDPILLEFDHVRGEKLGNISQMSQNSRSIESIQAEIDKCDVVCANCHRRRTAVAQRWNVDLMEEEAAVAA